MAKLLLVEDDNNLREIYEARLQAEGYTIVSAKDGEEALVVAKAEKPDLVISDVMMPKISGFEMLDILRNTDELKGVKVIMLTALGQSDDQQRADKLGADRYLVKSQVTLEDIVKVTHELLEGPSEPAAPAAVPATDAAVPTTDAPAPAAPPADKPVPEPTPQPVAEPKPEAEVKPATPEPIAEPPRAEPEAKPEPDASASEEVAKSTDEEEADVEAKIEDFVAGASSEPTTPDNAAAAPAPDATPASTTAAEASDDKLMADAVEQLSASTDNKDDKPSGDAAPTAPTPAPAPSTPAEPAPGATTTPTVIPVGVATDDTSDDKDDAKDDDDKKDDKPEEPATVGGNRVIQPLPDSGDSKKDINQLLAEEEAKEAHAAAANPAPGNAVVTGSAEDKPSGQSSTAPGAKDAAGGGVDPNSIAL